MTKSEAISKHRQLWNTIAEMIESGVRYYSAFEYKIEALKRIGEERYLHSNCYLCGYILTNDLACHQCPLKWKHIECGDSEYKDFENALYHGCYGSAYRIAREIANLPEKE